MITRIGVLDGLLSKNIIPVQAVKQSKPLYLTRQVKLSLKINELPNVQNVPDMKVGKPGAK